ncbi:MAG TPA: hypothetical protein VN619_00490 [Lacisediminihabitans sp.]|nr:hypothetical protein [Lacisediminihabitans sp.]HXD60380.1 hypothetical protein [Lacisediminihabitans sp.]
MANNPGTAVRPRARSARLWLLVRYRLTPWWLRVVVLWTLSRVVTTWMMLVFAAWQGPNQWTGAHPDYLQFAQFWDSGWYHTIATTGYPAVLPFIDGHVAANAWAFMPGYPFLVRALMEVTALPWEPMSVFVSLAFSLAGALAFYRLMRLVLPASVALFSTLLFCVAPLSPILQVSYAESMAGFLLTVTLYLLVRRRYLLMLPVIAVLALTRPTGLALALALALHVAFRWVRRGRDPYPARERVTSIIAVVFSGMMGLAWPAIAWLATGSPSAYTDTELAWRAPYIGYHELVPFGAWIQGAGFWMPGPLGIVALVLIVALFTTLLFLPSVRRLGTDLVLWIASYSLYLLAVFFPQSSTFRLLMPLNPLLGALAQPRSRIYRACLVVLFVAGQWGWIYICWWADGYDWTPP